MAFQGDAWEFGKRLEQVQGESMDIDFRCRSVAHEHDKKIGLLARISDELNCALPAFYAKFAVSKDAHSGRFRTFKDMEEDLSTRAKACWTDEGP